jgi:hypothetical protein
MFTKFCAVHAHCDARLCSALHCYDNITSQLHHSLIKTIMFTLADVCHYRLHSG